MSKTGYFFATSVVVLCTFCRGGDAAQNAPAVMSKYGEIQSVNKYSSNPFWTPTSPYNQRMPTPIYATGADLNTGDCNRVVQNLVTEYCTNHNNCSGTQLTDARPVIMVQLSQLPGHNFATSCGGYIDSIFEDYKKTYGNTSTNNIVKPTQQQKTAIQIENPFTQKKSAYETGVAERTAELEQLQSVTTPTPTVNPTDFPKTVADLSFTDRVANTTAGYEPYKDLSAYKTPQFETEQEYYERMKSVLEHDIRYIGATAPGCPAKYLTGRGATVSCAPILTNGTCDDVWCTDAAKTNCATEHKISSNDRDDKTFYAKCMCNPGYEPDGNKCVKPNAQTPENGNDGGTPGGGSGGGSDGGGNGGGSGGDSTTTESGPQCLVKMSQDKNFTNTLQSKLSSSTTLDINELKNKQAYADIAQAVHKFCVDSGTASPTDFSEFNTWIDSHSSLPISIPFNSNTSELDVYVEDLFNYVDYPYDVMIVQKNMNFTPQKTVKRSEVNVVSSSESCVNHYDSWGHHWAFGITPAVAAAAKGVYGATRYNVVNTPKWSFPGKLVEIDSVFQTFYKGVFKRPNIVRVNNYITARKKIKQFADNLIQHNGCSNKSMAVYLIMDNKRSLGETKVDEVQIKSEAFIIP